MMMMMMQTWKYDHLNKNTRNTIPALILAWYEKVVPRSVHDRAAKLGTCRESASVVSQAKKSERVQQILQSNGLRTADAALGVSSCSRHMLPHRLQNRL
jgi:hypothetical protein